jgi:hypothetical protein
MRDVTLTFLTFVFLQLTQSYAALAEHLSRIACIFGRAIGISEDVILSSTDALINGGDADNKKRKRDPNAPKRPPSSFLLFMADRRPILKKEHPDMPYLEMMKEIGNMWKALPEAQRQQYEDRYLESRNVFQKLQEEYLAKLHADETESPNKKVRTETEEANVSSSTSEKTEEEKGKKPEAKKAEAKKSESKKGEAKKNEAKKSEAKKANPKKAEGGKAEGKKAEGSKAEGSKAEGKKPEAKKTEAEKSESVNKESGKTEGEVDKSRPTPKSKKAKAAAPTDESETPSAEGGKS